MLEAHLPTPGAKPERPPVLSLVYACVGVVAFPAFLQLVLHPLL